MPRRRAPRSRFLPARSPVLEARVRRPLQRPARACPQPPRSLRLPGHRKSVRVFSSRSSRLYSSPRSDSRPERRVVGCICQGETPPASSDFLLDAFHQASDAVAQLSLQEKVDIATGIGWMNGQCEAFYALCKFLIIVQVPALATRPPCPPLTTRRFAFKVNYITSFDLRK